MASRKAFGLPLLLGIGLLLRLGHLVYTWQDNPLTKHLIADALYYEKWSQAVFSESPFYLPPLYPFLLALARWIFGGPLLPVLLLQAALGLLSLWLIFRIALRHFGYPAALASGLLALLYGPLLFFETKLLGVTLAVALGLACVELLNKGLARKSPGSLVLAGLAQGLLCEVRPNFLIFGFMSLLLVWADRNSRERRWKSSALFAAGLALPLALSLGYNLATCGEPILVTANGGINFYFGNHSRASGVNDAPTRDFSSIFDQQAAARRLAEADEGRTLSHGEVSGYWRNKAFREIAENPGAWSRLVIKKLGLFFSNFEYGVIYIPGVERHLSPIQTVQLLPTALILALGLGGAGLALRRKYKGLWPLLLFLASSLVTVLLFFMAGRFRLPFMAGIIPFAGFFICRNLEALREKDYGTLGKGLVLITGIIAASIFMVDSAIRTEQMSRARLSLSGAFQKAGDLEGAKAEAMAALEEKTTPVAYYQLGHIEEAKGNVQGARELYRKASELDPFYLEPLGRMALLYEKEKDWDRAVEIRERIIDVVPFRYEAYYNLALTCLDAGRKAEGKRNIEEAARRAPASAAAWMAIAGAYVQVEMYDKAMEALTRVKEIDPSRRADAEKMMEEIKAESRD